MHTSKWNRHLRSPSGAAGSSIPWAITTMPETARTAERLECGSYTAGPRQIPLGVSAQFGRGQSTQFGGPAQFSGPAQPRANTPLTSLHTVASRWTLFSGSTQFGDSSSDDETDDGVCATSPFRHREASKAYAQLVSAPWQPLWCQWQ